jgi:hypothetical protein
MLQTIKKSEAGNTKEKPKPLHKNETEIQMEKQEGKMRMDQNTRLLVPQCLNRIEGRSFPSGVHAEGQANE